MHIMRVLQSVRLAVGLLTVLAIACLVGTLVPQGRAFALVFGTPWFLGLLAALAVNLVCCTISRRRTWGQRPGSVIMHASILLIVAGALVDGIWGIRGDLTLHIGEAGSEFVAPQGKKTLPFTVRLVNFVVERYPPKLTVAVFKPNAQEPSATLDAAAGRILDLGRDAGELRVLQVKHNVVPKPGVAPAEGGPAAVELGFAGSGHAPHADVLVQGQIETVATPDRKLQCLLKVFPDAGARDRELVNVQPPGTGVGMIQVGDKDGTVQVAAEVGRTHKLADGSTLSILQYIPHFVLEKGTVRSLSDEPLNPAVQVETKKPGQDAVKTWLFAKFPDFGAMHGTAAGPKLAFLRPAYADYAATVLIYVVHGGDAAYAVLRRGNPDVQRGEVKAGAAIPVDADGLAVTIRRVLPHARVFFDVVDSKGAMGMAAAQVQLRVGGADRGEPLWLLATRETAALADTGLDVGLFPQEAAIKEFRSTVQVLVGKEVVKEQAVMVNHPLAFMGYNLYQSSYDREQERWSGLEIAKSPGVPLVYAGFTLFVLGLLVTLYGRSLIASLKPATKESAGTP